ncbi:DUF3592 domain-containing protein [Streptomyces sp. NRRL F-5123]|uniref:DUF3592 domain-containing protein n=1 Tax=Streptomyces sp. NRRL F-5123 TaxID=1463856 RepID=UPI0004E14614|nr:DUF3592 domain-containing protein [Streptomyces sp. NRRL F-5123]
MIFVAVAAAAFLTGAFGTVRAALHGARCIRARRSGLELQADVVGNDSGPTANAGRYTLTPVVRYHIEGRAIVSSLVNASGRPGPTGGAMTVVVDPARPYEPYDRYRLLGALDGGSIMLFLLGTALLVWSLAVV